ncbi:MAG TPA: DUF3147 family protein [Candidatus Methanoperedenaceae archaeon]|nr:DUF3147 family protein [Candidatus Methanoperedenaceae archaeon]
MYEELFLRFLIGGAVIAGTTWIAEWFDPKLGGIIANIPSATIVSLLLVGGAMGDKAAVDFAKGLVMGNIPWFAYIFSVILLAQRIGLSKSIAAGFIVWLLLLPLTYRLSQAV